MMTKTKRIFPALILMAAFMPTLAAAAATVSVAQTGADSGSVMAGKTFTVTASGWSGSCSSAYLDLTNCGVCSVSESQSKSISGSSVSWTTVTASKANSQSITVSISGACSPESGGSTFDVKNPPSVSATVSPASASVAQGSSFSLNVNIQNTGETTARFGTVTVSSPSYLSLSGCSPSDVAGGQSSGISCTVSASSGATVGSATLVLGINPTNADAITKNVGVTVTSSSGGTPETPSGGGGGGGGGAGDSKQQKNVTHKIAPPGLVNNTKLQAAIEKVLAKGKMNQNAIDNLVRLSNIVSGQTDVSRTITVEGNKSVVKTTVKYKGAKTAKNYVVYEKVPKAFANTSGSITVTALGAKVEVVEQDPEYAIVFDTVSPNQELAITYTLNKAVATNTVDSFATEVYAESLEEAAPVCAQVITPAKNTATGECKEFSTPCDVPAGWAKVDSCEAGTAGGETTPPATGGGETPVKTTYYYYLVAILVILALAYYFLVLRKGPK